MSVEATDVWRDHDSIPLLWLATASLALVAHLALLQAGVATYQAGLARDDGIPLIETKIIATALQVAGTEAPPPPELEASAVTPNAHTALSAQTLTPTAPVAQTLQATVTATPITPTTEAMTTPAPLEPPPVETLVARAAAPPAMDTVALDTRAATTTPLNQPGVAPVAASVSAQAALPAQPAPTVTEAPTLQTATLVSPVVTPEPDPVAEPEPAPEPEVAATSEPAPLPDLANSLPPSPTDVTEDQPGVASANAPTQTVEQAEQTYGTVVDFLRSFDGGPCFAALPVLAEDGAFRFETFAKSRADLTRFRQSLEISTGTLPGTVMKSISEAQCQALPFVTAAARYPEFQLYFDLSARQIPSGELLSGTLGNTSGGFVSLLLIDDEGVVQDLGSFLKFRPGFAGFDIPMTVKGEAVETQQLLMALSTRSRLRTLSELSGRQAEDFFQRLAIEIALQGGGEDVALVAFSVR